jgi:type I restriction enzyme S subunit
MTDIFPSLKGLRPNPDWAKLPLFDRRKWKHVRFDDVVENVNETERNPVEAGIERFIGLEHLEPGSLHIRAWGNVVDGTTFTRRCRPGQALFGKRRAYQRKVAVAEFDAVVSGDIYVFAPKNARLLSEFLPFLCMSERFFQHAVGTSAGSLSPRTNWSSLAGFEFDLPPLDQQRRTAEILWAVDEAENRHLNLQQTFTGLFEALAFEQFPKLNQSQFRFVPLSEICSRQPQSGLYKGPEFVGRGIKTVNMGELFGNDLIDQHVPMQCIELTAGEIDKYSLTSNDLLFGRRSIVLEGAGKCSMVGSLTEPTVFESSILRVTINPDKASSGFVFDWFNSPEGAKEIKRIRSFTTIAGITGSALKKVLVPLLPLEQQKMLFKTLTDHRTNNALLKETQTQITEMRRALLEAFIGEQRSYSTNQMPPII